MKFRSLAAPVIAALTVLAGPLEGTATAESQPTSSGESDGPWDGDATLRLAGPRDAPHLDPHRYTTNTFTWFMFPTFDRLTQTNLGVLEPMLAKSWEYSEDGLTLTMELRDDVTFHDGTPFNADVVVANLERAIELPESAVAGQLVAINGVAAISEFAVELTLSTPDATLPALFSTPAGSMINPAAFDDPDFGLHLDASMVSGPFTVTDFRPGDRVVYERAEAYWNSEVFERLPRSIEIVFIADPAARANAMQSGEIDIMNGPGAERQVLDIAESDGFEDAVVYPMPVVASLFFDVDKPPMDDVNVRKAFSAAIDVDLLMETIFPPQATTRADQFLPVDHWAAPPDYERNVAFDPELARQLLDDAGHGDGLTLQASVVQGAGSAYVEAVQGMLADVGIDLEITYVTPTDVFASFARGDFHVLGQSIQFEPDPALTISKWFFGGVNLAGDTAPELASMATEAGSSLLSQDDRAGIYHDLVPQIMEQHYFVPLSYTNTFNVARDGVVGVADNPMLPYNSIDMSYVGVLADD